MTTLTASPLEERRDRARTGPCLFVILECGRPFAASSRHELRGLDTVTFGRAPERRWERAGRTLAIGVPDPRMSQLHARLVAELDRWIVEDANSKNGVVLEGVRHQRAALDDGDVFELGHTLFLFRDASPLSDAVDRPDCDATQLQLAAPGLATFLPPLARAFSDLAQVAAAAAPVLLHGETGTGKELVARAVHELAGRRGAFVPVNCGALPASLVESELFGYRKGAFSGAVEDRDGAVRSADKGTLFLDEIGDLPPPAQAALLRVLQEREVTPLGSTRPISVDIKVVAATHHDLDQLVTRGGFRRDLYARIAGFVLRLPPLRARPEDLGILLSAIARRHAPDDAALEFSIAAGRALLRYDWPLNIRELDNTLSVAIALARGGPICLEHLTEVARERTPPPADAPPSEHDARRARLEELLRAHAGNISAIARSAGVSRIQVHRWLKRFGFDPATYRT